MSFKDDLNKFGAKTQIEVDKNRRAIVLELFSSVILDTPVDTGRARGNWQTSVSAPAEGVVERIDKSGSNAIAEIQKNLGEKDSSVYLTNNLPYIETLEYGHSKQAPEGMVRKNLARISSIVNRASRR